MQTYLPRKADLGVVEPNSHALHASDSSLVALSREAGAKATSNTAANLDTSNHMFSLSPSASPAEGMDIEVVLVSDFLSYCYAWQLILVDSLCNCSIPCK